MQVILTKFSVSLKNKTPQKKARGNLLKRSSNVVMQLEEQQERYDQNNPHSCVELKKSLSIFSLGDTNIGQIRPD